jgi:transcriptional regulator with XRE-family HTH domain
MNRTYIGSLEAGDRNPSLENIARLAVALGADAADLVKGLQKLKGRD